MGPPAQRPPSKNPCMRLTLQPIDPVTTRNAPPASAENILEYSFDGRRDHRDAARATLPAFLLRLGYHSQLQFRSPDRWARLTDAAPLCSIGSHAAGGLS